jgi:hypothetical protein
VLIQEQSFSSLKITFIKYREQGTSTLILKPKVPTIYFSEVKVDTLFHTLVEPEYFLMEPLKDKGNHFYFDKDNNSNNVP